MADSPPWVRTWREAILTAGDKCAALSALLLICSVCCASLVVCCKNFICHFSWRASAADHAQRPAPCLMAVEKRRRMGHCPGRARVDPPWIPRCVARPSWAGSWGERTRNSISLFPFPLSQLHLPDTGNRNSSVCVRSLLLLWLYRPWLFSQHTPGTPRHEI